MKEFKIVAQANDKLIQEMIKLDNIVYQGNDIGSFNKCKEWLSANQDIYTILLCDDEVVGYINFMPITDNAYTQIKLGKLKDYDLKSNQVVKFKRNQSLKCLFTSIVIHPKYQTGLALARLWNGFIDKIKSLNITISGIIMDCVSDIGEKCAIKYLNAKFITNSKNGKIYEGNIKELMC